MKKLILLITLLISSYSFSQRYLTNGGFVNVNPRTMYNYTLTPSYSQSNLRYENSNSYSDTYSTNEYVNRNEYKIIRTKKNKRIIFIKSNGKWIPYISTAIVFQRQKSLSCKIIDSPNKKDDSFDYIDLSQIKKLPEIKEEPKIQLPDISKLNTLN